MQTVTPEEVEYVPTPHLAQLAVAAEAVLNVPIEQAVQTLAAVERA